MKKIIQILFVAALIAVIYTNNQNVLSYTSGAPTGSTNAPGESTCATNMFCHAGIPNAGNGGTILMAMEDISNGYIGGTTYTIMPYVTQSSSTKIGFQTVALLANGNGAGSVAIMNAKTQMNSANGKEYVTHTASGNTNVGLHDWMYEWTAPPQGSGTVTIYGAFIASNNDMIAGGDSIYTDSLVITENTTGENEFQISDFKFQIYPVIAENEITVNYFSKENFLGEYFIYSVNGKLQSKKICIFFSGENSFKLNLCEYPKGVYFIFFNNGNFGEVQKLIKL